MSQRPASTLIRRVRAKLDVIVNGLAQLMASVRVERHSEGYGQIMFLGPKCYWSELNAEQRAAQIVLLRQYRPMFEIIEQLFRVAPEAELRRLGEVDKQFRIWLDFDSNWSLAQVPQQNEAKMREAAEAVFASLSVLEMIGKPSVILVPDTNSLLKECDPVAYRRLAPTSDFEFMLLPTVLGELDKLKNLHRNADVQAKAEKAIKRVKGWRIQGPLLDGVTVDKNITVRASHAEPDMEHTLSWLDAAVPDDRIVASVISLQAAHPAARVILVTGDINLQNKADAAFTEVADPP